MSNNFIIKNKKDFINGILTPISNLSDTCILKLNSNKLSSTLASTDATIVLNCFTAIEYDGEETVINIPDVKKFSRLLQCLPKNEVTLKLGSNVITYNDGDYKFSFYLLEDGILKQPSLNVDKLKDINFDTTFTVSDKKLSALLKGSMFTTESSKLYFYCEGGKVFGELGDRNKHNCNQFSCEIANQFNGNSIDKAIPISYDSFKLLVFTNPEIIFSINNELGIVVCKISKENTTLIYVISSLIN